MHKRISPLGLPMLLLFSLNQVSLAASCNDEQNPVAPTVIDPLKGVADSMQNHSGVQIKVNGILQSHIQKPELSNFTTDFFAVLNDPNNPNYIEYSQDAAAADAVYNFVLSKQTLTGPNPLPISHPSFVGVGGPLPIQPIQPIQPDPPLPVQPLPPVQAPVAESPPTNTTELRAYLGKQKLSPRAAEYLVSKFTAKGGKLYGNAPGKPPKSKEEQMENTFQAILTGQHQAGECGPIHQFGAFVADSLGMKNTCLLGADWKDKGTFTTAHDVLCFQDPNSKKLYFVNYGDVTKTRSVFLSEAAQEEALNMSILSASVTPETRVLWQKSHVHQMQGERSKVLVNAVHSVGQVGAPGVAVQLGTQRNQIAAQKIIVGSPQNKVGVFAVGLEDHSEIGYQSAVGGLYGHAEGKKMLTSKVALGAAVDGEAGGFIAHDVTPKGNTFSGPTRTDQGVLLTGRGETDLSWKTKKLPGKVGVEAKYDQPVYISKEGTSSGNPFNTLNFKASTQVTPRIETHADIRTGFYLSGMWKQIPAAPSLMFDYGKIGVTTNHSLDHGKLALTNSVDYYHFHKGADAFRDEIEVSAPLAHNTRLSLRGEGAYIRNSGPDPFYDYAPTGTGIVKLEKKTSKGTFALSGQGAINDHKMFNYLRDDTAIPDAGTVTNPKAAGSITWTR